MPVPTYEELMLPFLRVLESGETLHIRQIVDRVSAKLELTDKDLTEMIPSGQSTVFGNRMGWARTYMKKAGVIEAVARAQYRITTRGTELLRSNPPTINGSVLRRYPEFVEFVKPTRADEPASENPRRIRR